MHQPLQQLPAEHPHRLALAAEVHARPSDALEAPCRATYVAILIDPADRALEVSRLQALCAHFNVAAPEATANHFSARLGELRFKWEKHGEFSGYTFVVNGLSPLPFSEPPVQLLPEDWLASLPGATLVAAHAKLIATPSEAIDTAFLARHFADNLVIGGTVGEGAGAAYTDFTVHADGYSRFLLVDDDFTPRQAGRMMQRLFEIEAYRMMALLALPIARTQSAHVIAIEAQLSTLAAEIAAATEDDEVLLQKVTRLAAEVENGLATSQFRFSACRAYYELVSTRIAELREQRVPGIQPIAEFMARRFTPAVATCTTVSQRLHDLSERVARASALLSTRVDIARERQNQALLGSMDKRARMQLRLQETVEGLSVAAIVYYAAGLVGYLAKALDGHGITVAPDVVVGVSIPLLVVVVIVLTRRARRRALRDPDSAPS